MKAWRLLKTDKEYGQHLCWNFGRGCNCLFSTLSFSGCPLFNKWNRDFDVVIIDEAAQSVEPFILVPLANVCKQVFLVGHPVQLPATVIFPVLRNLVPYKFV